MLSVEIGAVRLSRRGGENDPDARAVVEVEVRGRWVEVLSEPLASNFCSGVSAGLIAHRAGIVEKTETVGERLALDISLEKARALNRVWRGLNDGDCPKCHRHCGADHVIRNDPVGSATGVGRSIACPLCGFKIEAEEIKAIQKLFAPAMDGAVQVFEEWRAIGRNAELHNDNE